MWHRWQLTWLVSSAGLKISWHKPSNYQVSTATASEYIWNLQSSYQEVVTCHGIAVFVTSYKDSQKMSSCITKAQHPFLLSPSPSAIGIQDIAPNLFVCQRAMRFVTHIPEYGYRVTHQYLSVSTEDLTGKQIIEILKLCPHHLSGYSSTSCVKPRC